MADQLVEVFLEQGSPEWHAFRREHRPASMTSWITGTSKYNGLEDAFNFYVKGESPQVSDWVKRNLFDRGHEQEALARDTAELVIGECGRTGVFKRGLYSASLDFLGEKTGRCIDIKSPKSASSSTWKAALAGVIEPQYADQIEHQCRVLGASAGGLFVYLDDENHRFIPYALDDQRWGEICRAWDEFFEMHVKTGLSPGPIEVTDAHVKELLDSYAKIEESMTQLAANKDAIKKEIEAKLGNKNARAFGWSLTRSRRKGSIAYDEIVRKHCPLVDVEEYRDDPSEPFYTFRAPAKPKAEKATKSKPKSKE